MNKLKLLLQSIFNREKYIEGLGRFNIKVCSECGDILLFKDELKAGICRGCIFLGGGA